MKRFLLGTIAVGLLTAGFVAPVAAQNSPKDTLPPVQPPPEMDSPAAKAAAPAAKAPAAQATGSNAPLVPLANSDAEAQAAAAAEAAATAERAKALNAERADGLDAATAPPKPNLSAPPLPPDVQKAAEATELPVITVRQNGNERIEEYRKKGVLYFVRVQPQEGPPRYYVDNPSNLPPDIRQLSAPSGTVQPVYYKLVDWK